MRLVPTYMPMAEFFDISVWLIISSPLVLRDTGARLSDIDISSEDVFCTRSALRAARLPPGEAAPRRGQAPSTPRRRSLPSRLCRRLNRTPPAPDWAAGNYPADRFLRRGSPFPNPYASRSACWMDSPKPAH